jgi:AraC family transcriptional regulator, regulatory protein of adaptative response / methylated-DNA-[protein]-cysteine methyltransferase
MWGAIRLKCGRKSQQESGGNSPILLTSWDMNDYERIASVIRYLDRHHIEQPDLSKLARSVGLSPFHFHRLFSRWAGVTPKDFVQCLTVENVKQLLRSGASVLDTALNVGLSGPGRLHDLCVTLEAASPGEIKSGGFGTRIEYGFAGTPFGRGLIAETNRGICHLAFVNGQDISRTRSLLLQQWPHAELHRDDQRAQDLAAKIFMRPAPGQPQTTLRAFVRGTPFQVQVWRALLHVPTGSVTSYGRISAAIQQPTAARAVGSAVGANPIAFIIPCHRVIRETGAIGNYHWDPIRKRAILGWEMSQLCLQQREPTTRHANAA